MNVEIGTEAVQFPEKEYINGIFVAVYDNSYSISFLSPLSTVSTYARQQHLLSAKQYHHVKQTCLPWN